MVQTLLHFVDAGYSLEMVTVLYPSHVKRRFRVDESCHGQVPSPIRSVVMSVPIKANFGSIWSKVVS